MGGIHLASLISTAVLASIFILILNQAMLMFHRVQGIDVGASSRPPTSKVPLVHLCETAGGEREVLEEKQEVSSHD